MKDFLSLAASRRSIRKYGEDGIPDTDLAYFIDTAVAAPSGCNSQCWNFVAVRDKEVMRAMAEAIAEETRRFYTPLRPVDADAAAFDALLEARNRSASFFTEAPVVVAVFMTKLGYYDPRITELFSRMGYSHESMMERMSWPDVLSIGAAIQNMLLAIHERGYGACWMNEPAIAGRRMNGILGVPEEQRFISLVPVGRPAHQPKNKIYKKLEDVFRIIG